MFIWIVMISRILNKRAKKFCIPCPNFGESHFPGSSQIPDLGQIFIIFPIPALYFGQILDPENTLPDPYKISRKWKTKIKAIMWQILQLLLPKLCVPFSKQSVILINYRLFWMTIILRFFIWWPISAHQIQFIYTKFKSLTHVKMAVHNTTWGQDMRAHIQNTMLHTGTACWCCVSEDDRSFCWNVFFELKRVVIFIKFFTCMLLLVRPFGIKSKRYRTCTYHW